MNTKETANVELTKEQVNMLKDKNIPVTISKEDIQLVIPVGNLVAGQKVEIMIKPMKANGSLGVFDFTIFADGKAYHQFEEDMTLVFQVDSKKVKNPNNVKVFYYNEETKVWELIGGTYEDGKITAKTKHFSTYGVFEVEAETKKAETDTDKNTDTNTNNLPTSTPKSGNSLPSTATNAYNTLILGALLLFAGFGVYGVKRRLKIGA